LTAVVGGFVTITVAPVVTGVVSFIGTWDGTEAVVATMAGVVAGY